MQKILSHISSADCRLAHKLTLFLSQNKEEEDSDDDEEEKRKLTKMQGQINETAYEVLGKLWPHDAKMQGLFFWFFRPFGTAVISKKNVIKIFFHSLRRTAHNILMIVSSFINKGPLPEATPTESDRRILPDLVGFVRI